MKNNGLQEWNQIAQFWDSKTKDGNAFYNEMVGPSAKRLLNLTSTDSILELACSSGLFSREIAPLVKNVLATDYCEDFISIAKQRQGRILNLQHEVLDCTDLDSIVSLGKNRFTKVVCNMAIFDISDIHPLFKGLSYILSSGGLFVLTTGHPVFNSTEAGFYIEETTRNGYLSKEQGMKIRSYLSPFTADQTGIEGQPVPHKYYHRSLQDILKPAFENGFVLDAFEELTLPPKEGASPLSWRGMQEIPAIIAVRLIKM